MTRLSAFGLIVPVLLITVVTGCYTSVPNGSDEEVLSTPHVVIDTSRDRKPVVAAGDEQIEIDPANNGEITVEFVNGLDEPFSLRCTEDAGHEISGLGFSIFRNGRPLRRVLTLEPRLASDFHLRRLSKNESVISTVLLLPWFQLEDVASGPCELRLTYEMSSSNAYKLTPAHLEKRVGLRIRKGRDAAQRRQPRLSSPDKWRSTAKG